MTNRLTPIIEHKHQEVAALYQQVQQHPERALAQLLDGSLTLPPCKSFKQALQTDTLAIIAEIKRKSPSKGHLATIADPLVLAMQYIESGANAISILTDTPFFGGHLSDLQRVAMHMTRPGRRGTALSYPDLDYLNNNTGPGRRGTALPCPDLDCSKPNVDIGEKHIPLLRKDFIIDPIQLAEARLAGADAVLAIVSVLGDKTAAIISQATALGLVVLVEVHTQAELDIALAADTDIIGINNRDLNTMVIDTEQALRLIDSIPSHICKVAESGILVPELAKRYRQAGFDAVLIGEALVTTDNPQSFIEACRDV